MKLNDIFTRNVVTALRTLAGELFNLADDLAEKNNLAQKDPKRLKQMSDKLVK